MTGGSVLLVDDEVALLDLLRRYLERNQFTVRASPDAAEALRLVKAAPSDFWLLITDLTLPGISGEELIERVRTMIPGMPAIVLSGYAYQPRLEGVEFLQKPFLPKMLLEMVQGMMNSAARGSGGRAAKHRA